jgi:hypothetical protein
MCLFVFGADYQDGKGGNVNRLLVLVSDHEFPAKNNVLNEEARMEIVQTYR